MFGYDKLNVLSSTISVHDDLYQSRIHSRSSSSIHGSLYTENAMRRVKR